MAQSNQQAFDEGNNGRVYQTETSTVIKVQKRNSLGHDVITQKRIHYAAQKVISEINLKILRVPRLQLGNPPQYEMELINTHRIIYLGDPNHGTSLSPEFYEALCCEITQFWIALINMGFAAWDYELFLQDNGTVMLIDFDKFGFRMTSGPVSIQLPQIKRGSETRSCMPDLHYFFQNPCFPHDFVKRLQALGFEPPADCLPTRKNED
jgi:hypothetical protein